MNFESDSGKAKLLCNETVAPKCKAVISMATETTYKYLEARPHPWRKQLWIKGRNMTVWQLLCQIWANGETPEKAAKSRGLPIEAIYEALDYFRRNRELLLEEAKEEKRRLKEHGWDLGD